MTHPILESRSRVLIWCLAWVILAAGQASVIHFVYGSTLDIAVADGIISMLLYCVLGIAIWFPVRYMLRSNNKVMSTIINVILTGSVTIVLWLFVTRPLVRAMVPEKEDYDLFWHTVLVFRVAAGVLIFFVVTLIYYLYLSATQLAEKASRQAQLEAQVREGELKMLRAQINPHFLFNSLNSMSSLTLTDPMKAREMILKLSDFMRYSLSSHNEQPVTLQNEMESLRLYLEIEKVRFGERLIIEEDIQPECLTALLPGMLLQPLYENAVKHGVYESTETVVIRTSAHKENGLVVISVSNNIDPESVVTRKGAGIGLINVRSRLELFFGEKADLTVTRKDDSFNVTVKFPYRKS
ncbi:MAG: histidine kinase [Bacteroidales bacterium]|jgi:two-component system LytT family sensor kinase